MERRRFLAGVAAGALGPARGLLAQRTRIVRVAWVTPQTPEAAVSFLAAFRDGMRALGYVEGSNLTVEPHFAHGDAAKLRLLAQEAARSGVDLIVTAGGGTATVLGLALPVPVLFTTSADPVAAGFADELSRPRGNASGLTFMAVELNGKRLELMREIFPRLRKAAIIGDPGHAGMHLERSDFEQMGAKLGVDIAHFATRNVADLEAAMAEMSRVRPEAISLLADSFSLQNRARIIDRATSLRVPVFSGWAVFARSGALCTYGPNQADVYRRLAHYVDRVVRGAKASELPIERPTRFELIVNVAAARALDVVLPPSLLARADEVIG